MSSQNEDEADDYLEYARGDVTRHGGADDGVTETPWGKTGKHHWITLRVFSETGRAGFPYHSYAGHEEGDNWFSINFCRCTVGDIEATWKLTVNGQKLEKAIHFFSMGQLATLKVGGTVEGPDPYITAIEWVPFHPDDAPMP